LSQEDIIEQQISMATFFDKVKTSMLARWEYEIVKKSTGFQTSQSLI